MNLPSRLGWQKKLLSWPRGRPSRRPSITIESAATEMRKLTRLLPSFWAASRFYEPKHPNN